MQAGNAAFFRKRRGVFEHLFALGRKTGDHISTECDIRPEGPHLVTETDGIGPQMTAFHAFQDHVVAMLEGQVKMRHETRLTGNQIHQMVVSLDAVDRG
ncbi:hypothetical protein D3C87_1478390 [compost metagenome]